MLLAESAELAETIIIFVLLHVRISMQISFFSFINFFQSTFIAFMLCTEHFFKHRVFKGKAAEAFGVQVICHVTADVGSHQLLPPAWGHFCHLIFLVVHLRGPRTVSSNFFITQHPARCLALPGAQ